MDKKKTGLLPAVAGLFTLAVVSGLIARALLPHAEKYYSKRSEKKNKGASHNNEYLEEEQSEVNANKIFNLPVLSYNVGETQVSVVVDEARYDVKDNDSIIFTITADEDRENFIKIYEEDFCSFDEYSKIVWEMFCDKPSAYSTSGVFGSQEFESFTVLFDSDERKSRTILILVNVPDVKPIVIEINEFLYEEDSEVGYEVAGDIEELVNSIVFKPMLSSQVLKALSK